MLLQNDELIYTWRKLPYPGDAERSFEIEWRWSDWDHAANDRQHLLEAERLWRLVFEPEVIDPLLEALRQDVLEGCHSAFQRIAGLWSDAFHETFSRPRVVQCEASPVERQARRSTCVFLFATRHGLIFIVRRKKNTRRLRTFYFPKPLVNGLALFPVGFEQTALTELVDTYTACSRGVLPDPANRTHRVRRRHEIDRKIRFHDPDVWGFASSDPGAVWKGLPTEAERAQQELDEDVPIAPPPNDNGRWSEVSEQ